MVGGDPRYLELLQTRIRIFVKREGEKGRASELNTRN